MNRLMRNPERGSVMILISFVILIISVLGAVYAMTTLSTHRLARTYHDGDQALAAAMGGLEYGLYRLAHVQDPEDVDFEETVAIPYGDPNSTADDIQVRVKSQDAGTQASIVGGLTTNLVRIEADATVRGMTRGVRSFVFNNSYEVHELYYKAIFSANSHGVPYTLQFTGKSNDADRIRGDAHNNGDIEFSLNAFATWNWGNNKCTATGSVHRVDNVGNINLVKGGGDPAINAPDLHAMNYDSLSKRYREWDPNFQGGDRNVVSVNDAYNHYSTTDIAIAREGGYNPNRYSGGAWYEWNSRAQVLPDNALANFFQKGYQNHFVDGFDATDDQRIDATENFYLGARNNGSTSRWGDRYGLYGGGHAVITINQDQNNKIYYVEGNLWVDSDGCNHVFFVPGPGVDKVNITVVVKGNIYIGDQIWTTKYDKNKNIGGSTSCQAFRKLDSDTGIAFIAMSDGESYDDTNGNGKYDVGETILGRTDPATPNAAARNPSSPGSYVTNYQGRMEGSGNIVFGDTISGPVGAVEAFLYAENNFQDITADTSQGDQNPFTYGNMTAGNRVYLKRNYADWQQLQSINSPPAGWVKIGSSWYPPGTTAANKDNPFLTERRWYNKKLYTRRHNPLQVTLDERILDQTVDLPGLPHSTDIHEGTWSPKTINIIEGEAVTNWGG